MKRTLLRTCLKAGMQAQRGMKFLQKFAIMEFHLPKSGYIRIVIKNTNYDHSF